MKLRFRLLFCSGIIIIPFHNVIGFETTLSIKLEFHRYLNYLFLFQKPSQVMNLRFRLIFCSSDLFMMNINNGS